MAKGLLDLIVLQLLNNQSMHGYQIITKIRKSFGVHFGPSTIYPLLATLEKKGHVTSSLNLPCYKIGTNGTSQMNVEAGSMKHFQKEASFMRILAK